VREAMSFKARIRNIAKKKRIPAQVILQNYMFERFLIRLSVSCYKENFILKGGLLVASLVGIDNRATMDLDTMLRNLPLNEKDIENIIRDICEIDINDGIVFQTGNINPIREDDCYGGYRIFLTAKFDTILTPLHIDVSTGDVITPCACKRNFFEIFDENKSYELFSYNIETVLAEKIETILRRSVFNTRPRDFYDVYVLSMTQNFDKQIFKQALSATAKHRNSLDIVFNHFKIIETIENSVVLKAVWNKYRKNFEYARNIEFLQIIKRIKELLN